MRYILVTMLLGCLIYSADAQIAEMPKSCTRCWPQIATSMPVPIDSLTHIVWTDSIYLVHGGEYGAAWTAIPSLTFWGIEGDGKNIYDSGRIEITGDTILTIRALAKQYDSLTRKYWDLQNYTQAIIDAVAGMRGTDAQIARYYAAVRKYNVFVYGHAPKKKRRKG
jgi:hypothetical protein